MPRSFLLYPVLLYPGLTVFQSVMSHLQVILRAEIVESVQAGDRYDFTGTLIVVPDVGALAAPGNYIREHELVHKKKIQAKLKQYQK